MTFCVKKVAHQYQCPDAMSLCSKLKAAGQTANPVEVAEAVVAALAKSSIVSKVEVVKPGFMNIFLDSRWVWLLDCCWILVVYPPRQSITLF